MSGEYTKGPWIQFAPEIGGEVDEDYRTIQQESYRCLRDGGFQITGYVAEANARLIAAAPELLEALEGVVGCMRKYEIDVDGTPPLEHREMMKQARSAIKKAKGES